MENDAMPSSCNFLKQPLSISDLIESGTNFEINTNFDEGFSNEIYEELNLGSDDDDDAENKVDHSTLVSPWTKPFAELKQQMEQVNEMICKRTTQQSIHKDDGKVPLNARVCIRYNAYWEGESTPFDSSFLRGSSHKFYTGRNEVLEGLEAAVLTMHRGEQAQFIISYHLLFHDMGCPPRVKPRADGLFIIDLVSFNEVGDIDADQKIPEEDRNKFSLMHDKVKEIHKKGLDFFGQGMYRNASRAFEKAVDVLNFCRLANEEEQREQTSFLVKLYTNLAVCYIKINIPQKTCIVCKEIRRLTKDNSSCKALFQEGRALFMLGEYERSRQLLTRAQRLEPHNQDITSELKKLDISYSIYRQNEKSIWTKAMGIINEPQKPKLQDEDAFEEKMLEVMKAFKENLDTNHIKLPIGLTQNEIHTVDDLAKKLELKLFLSPLDNKTYTLTTPKNNMAIFTKKSKWLGKMGKE